MNTFPTVPATRRPVVAAALACLASSAFSQSSESTLPAVQVEATRSVADRNSLPVTTESVTARKVEETVNAMTVEDT
ncbi:MAG: hypothetical protein ACJ8G3_17465, partial [Burkholderiaceae bacterium]